MYADSEMVIWQSSGRSSVGLVKPALIFAAPVLVVVASLALVVWPWTNAQTREIRDRYEKRGDLERVKPGEFQESASGNRVFFIDKDSPSDLEGTHIFIAARRKRFADHHKRPHWTRGAERRQPLFGAQRRATH
jgi:lipopolysaccharide export system permease protein